VWYQRGLASMAARGSSTAASFHSTTLLGLA
jgi:hypothetical protein